MMKKRSSILWAGLLVSASLAAGCASSGTVRDDWEEELRGAMNLDCRNIDHLGYGMHYDIVLDQRQVPMRNEALVRPAGRPGHLTRPE